MRSSDSASSTSSGCCTCAPTADISHAQRHTHPADAAHVACSDLRDISNLTTAPMDRRAIVTEVMGLQRARAFKRCDRAGTGARGAGLLCPQPRALDIEDIAASDVQALAPDARKSSSGTGRCRHATTSSEVMLHLHVARQAPTSSSPPPSSNQASTSRPRTQ